MQQGFYHALDGVYKCTFKMKYSFRDLGRKPSNLVVLKRTVPFPQKNTQLKSISLLLSLAHYDIFNCDKKEVFQMV